jgi:hypothetical protein
VLRASRWPACESDDTAQTDDGIDLLDGVLDALALNRMLPERG